MDKEDWKVLSSTKAHENPWFAVIDDEIIHYSGYKKHYFTVETKPGVFAIPFDGEKILMVSQYRHPLRQRIWSFPAGSCETDDILGNAKKELKEETGYSAGKWTLIANFASNTSLNNADLSVYLAEDLSEGQHQREGGEVDMTMEFKTIDEIENMLHGDGLVGSDTVAAFYYLKKHLKNRK